MLTSQPKRIPKNLFSPRPESPAAELWDSRKRNPKSLGELDHLFYTMR